MKETFKLHFTHCTNPKIIEELLKEGFISLKIVGKKQKSTVKTVFYKTYNLQLCELLLSIMALM